MTPETFVSRWKKATLTERQGAQSHWNDLCELLEQPTPTAHDPEGETYCFERGAHKVAGGDGWADVWWKGKFAVEYKRKRKNLDAAYQQLLQYREDLGNPPLLIVIDLNRFEVGRPVKSSRDWPTQPLFRAFFPTRSQPPRPVAPYAKV